MYSRMNTPQIPSPHGRTPSTRSFEELLGDLPNEVKYDLPPVTTPAAKLRYA
jgi:hypothetical protein